MSLFIHRENQDLLWNIINKSPFFLDTFKHSHPDMASNWFRSVIQNYYYDNNLQSINVLTPATLNSLNRNVLSYMVSNLKKSQTYSNTHNNTMESSKQNATTFMETNYSRMNSNSKEDNYSNQFAARQKEYETMFAKPTPPVDTKLNDNIKDEVITNMEELIEQHRKQREDELKMVQPPLYSNNKPVILDAIQPLTQTIQSVGDPNKVKIKESTLLEPENFIELKLNKSVSWKDESYSHLEQEIHLLKQQMADLLLKNKEYEEKIDNFIHNQQFNT